MSNRYIGQKFITLQVVFQPGALYRLTGIPAQELTNQYLDADVILTKDVNLVEEQLAYARDYREMIQIVEQYLRTHIKKSRKEAHGVEAMGKLMIGNYSNTLDWYSKQICLCHRQFDRMFKERMGINPKLFLRIIRFDKAFRMKNQYPDKDWLSIAIDCGYYDYQHLVKDYKEFTGFTPTEFYHIETKSPQRFFGDTEI